MNAAICSRVTVTEGQNLVFAGGLHPLVIPLSAIHWMSGLNTLLSSTSMKSVAANAAIGKSRNAAIAANSNARCCLRFNVRISQTPT
jgi:hypothetical protein